jgi:serine/threonine protein kinase
MLFNRDENDLNRAPGADEASPVRETQQSSFSSANQFDSGCAIANLLKPADLSRELELDTIISGQYRVLAKLGSGGMSNVYLCKDILLKRVVAIKLLRFEISPECTSGKRFRREAQIVAMLDQPNIVKLYGLHFSEKQQPFIVMEAIDGESLQKVIEKSGRLKLTRTIKIVSQICSALSSAHALGVVHRDLKPSNIMVINAGLHNESIKLLDFGIAKIVDDQRLRTTRTGEVLGSPVYMSPEQALGQSVDEKSDQYSLGCLIFELLTGRPPFVCDNSLALMLAHVNQPPPSLSEVSLRTFPLQIELAVAKLLEKNPADRFATIEDVGLAFAGKTIPQQRFGKRLRTIPFLVPSVITLALISLASFVALRTHVDPPGQSKNIESHRVPRNLSNEEIDIFNRLQSDPMTSSVDLTNKKISDLGMKALSGLRFVERVNLSGCYRLTDMGLKYLVGWPLRFLSVKGTQLTDDGMQAISSISTLESLDLSDTDVSNAGCRLLRRLSKLRALRLSRTSINGNALKSIAKLTDLEELLLNGDDISGHLGALEPLQLRELQMMAAGLNDQDLENVSKMKSFDYLRMLGEREWVAKLQSYVPTVQRFN